MKIPRTRSRATGDDFLGGQLLFAMPVMSERGFARSVVYLCARSEDALARICEIKGQLAQASEPPGYSNAV